MAKKKAKTTIKKVAKKAAKKSTKTSRASASKVVKKAAKKPVKKAAKKTAPRKAVKKAAAKKPVAKAPQRTLGINPYLTFPGNCEEAFNFYRSVVGGQFVYIGRFKEMPPVEGMPLPESEGEKIMHISLPIGSGILMGSDSSEAFGHATNIGNNFSISVNTTSTAEADKLFNGLSEGGKVTMPIDKTFWGSYYGMFTDKYGIQWMVSFDENQNM